MKSTKKMMSLINLSLIGLFLAMAVPSFAQIRFTMPRIPTVPHVPSVPRVPSVQRTPSVQTPRSVPQATPRSVPQSTPRSTPQPTPKATSQPRPQAIQPATRPQATSRKEVKQEQKTQAREQKQNQKQNKAQQKEQARQQKEQKKQQQKQQKEAARQQKETQKEQKKNAKNSVKEPKPAKNASTAASRKSTATPATNGSQTRLQELNSNRSNLSGINRKPLPSGQLTVHPNGRMSLAADGGRQYGLRSNGSVASYSDRGKTVSFDKRGEVSSIHTANMDIHRAAHGQRTVISRRADGSKVVSTGRHSGYVERRVVMNNRTYVQRTTVIRQQVFTRTFVANGFGGVVFVPRVFFAPAFYGWAYYPWAAPIHFAWGWFGAPWYLGPNPYFVASPIYPSAAFWLTDHIIGETLATAYQLHHDAAADLMADDMGGDNDDIMSDATDAGDSDNASQENLRADATTPITPELKAVIAEQVKQELANDNAASHNSSQASFDTLPAALSTPNHVFVVSTDLDVTTEDQQLCTLQAGDMLQLTSPAASDSNYVQLRVASSKRMDCPAGVLVTISMPDIQEMENNFHAELEAGLDKLQQDQGHDGLPSLPPAAAAAPQPAVTGIEGVSGPESATLLDQQREQADQAQAQAKLGNF